MNASRNMRGSTTKSKPRNFVMSAGGLTGASTLGVSVTLGASTTDVVFNTALDAAGAAFLTGVLRVRRRVEDVVKCETCERDTIIRVVCWEWWKYVHFVNWHSPRSTHTLCTNDLDPWLPSLLCHFLEMDQV